MSKMLDALKRLQSQGVAPAAMPTINNTGGQIDSVREVAAAVDQAVAETEQRLRAEYEQQVTAREQALVAQRQQLELELDAEKKRLEQQLAGLQSQLQSHQTDSASHDELRAELEAELETHLAESTRLREADEARFLQDQAQLTKRLDELGESHQYLVDEAADLSLQLERKEAELQKIQQAIQATPTVDEQALRASLSAELTQQAEQFACKEAELNAALAEARQTIDSHQRDLAEIVRLRAEEKAKFESARAAAEPPRVEQEPQVAETPPVEASEPPSLLRTFTSTIPRPHLVSYEEQTLAELQDARIRERYEQLAHVSSQPTSTLFLSADGGDDAHQAGFHTALAAARENRRVLIIDGDVHGKQLSQRLGMRDSLGFYEVIRRETKWTERVVGLRCGEIDFLPAGRSLYTVSRSDLESAQAVWRDLSEIWPLIILVGEHPGAVSTELYGVLCQSIYLTACLGRATKDDVTSAAKRIASIGGRIEAAVAMNAKLN
ncbi:hypothetical protein [Blastopirellula marina]|uniref:Uncharacterized protein n=1 Tax=Blastopirellula marina DSM 3645 TaxID=314230 RepID=A3ZY04_9BACT|nr:hypothetical protein [Blastopirellula marina]EAQ78715.1 hypothetical protein DSM3645_07980 [Blastopirellula marina DSM 3645]